MEDFQLISASGKNTSRLSKCAHPMCATYCYGSAQLKPWRTEGKHNKATFHHLKYIQRETAYTYIMTSSVPGLVHRMVGFLGSKTFHCTSFFVDDRCDCTFVHHQFSTSTEDTIKAKHDHEYDMRKHVKEVRYHHADNRTYSEAS